MPIMIQQCLYEKLDAFTTPDELKTAGIYQKFDEEMSDMHGEGLHRQSI